MTDHAYSNAPKAGSDSSAKDEREVVSRRQSLKAVAKYAAFVAPAMTVLVQGSAEAAPNCDNPGLHLGVNRNGHSGC